MLRVLVNAANAIPDATLDSDTEEFLTEDFLPLCRRMPAHG